MSHTPPPRINPGTVTISDKGMTCPTCGKRSDYVLAQVGGAYTYQPCGCYGGKATA